MSALAPTLEAFFSQRLIAQRDASPRTVAAYRDTWRLLLRFASERTGKQPCQLDIADLDAPLIGRSPATSKPSGVTARAPATRGWRRSTPSTGSRH